MAAPYLNVTPRFYISETQPFDNMEKIKFKNSRGLNLAGNFYQGDSDAIIIMTHGFTGDAMEHPGLRKAAETFNQNGFSVLSFDFSGCGESDDDTITVEKEVDDLNSAIRYAEDKGFSSIGIMGYSLGGLVALKSFPRSFSNRIKTMVLAAPLTEYSERLKKIISVEKIKRLSENGTFILNRNTGPRKKIVLDKQLIEEITKLNQKEILCSIKRPILIIHGDSDELIPFRFSEKGLQYLPPDSQIEKIKGANHLFSNHDEELAKYSLHWFNVYLKGNDFSENKMRPGPACFVQKDIPQQQVQNR